VALKLCGFTGTGENPLMAILSWWSIATVSLVVGAITVLVAVGHRSRARASSGVASTAALWVTRIIAGFYAAGSVIGTMAGASQRLWSESVNVRLPVELFGPRRIQPVVATMGFSGSDNSRCMA
jgi:hypothetical protein